MKKSIFKGKKVIIFDMDGTLIDSIGIWNETDKMLVKRLGNIDVEIEDVQQMRDNVLNESKSDDIYVEWCDFLSKKYGINIPAKEMLDIRWKISEEYLINKMDYRPCADKVLQILRDSGYILALATTTTKVQLDIYRNQNDNMRKKVNIDEMFSIILSKEDVKDKKPSPEVHNKILERTGAKPEECLIIEDSLIGVEAAKNAGIEVAVIHDKYSDSDREKINELADYNFECFDEMLHCIEQEIGEERE